MIVLAVVPFLFFAIGNADFFEQAAKERKQGYTWNYTGKQALDPRAKARPLQCIHNGKPCGDPFIIWKLKK